MSEYTAARGPASERGDLTPLRPSDEPLELRLERAETLNRIGARVRFDEPLDDVLNRLAADIVAETRAVACGVMLLDPGDLSGKAFGSCNLPEGYIELMAALRRGSVQETFLRDSLAANRSWVLRDAVDYLLTRPEYEPAYHLIRQVPYRTLVGTPFFNRPDMIGLVYVYYARDVEVDDNEIAFARAIAERASPVMDNAWLFAQTQRRAAELEALSKADRALHEAVELDAVLQALIDLAVDLFGADRSLFLAFDEHDRLHAHVTRGVPEDNLVALQEVYHAIGRERFANQGPELGIVEDVSNDPRVNPEVQKLTPSKSVVDVPVFVDGAFFGIFVLGYHNRRTFDAEDRRLLETLAARAGLAIHKALLYRQAQRRASELEALHRADEALHRSLKLEDVQQAMVDLAVQLLGARSSLVVSWDESGRLAVRATTGIGLEERAVINERYQLLTKDRFAHWTAPFRTAFVEDVYTNQKIDFDRRLPYPRSLAEIPVVVGGELWGFFSIGWRQQRTFNEEDRRVFDAFAARASLAIQNALHFEESARRNTELEALYRADEALHRSLRLDDVLQAMVDLALELMGAHSSLVAIRGDGDVMQVVASRGLSETMLEKIDRAYRRSRQDGPLPTQPRMGIVEDISAPGVNPELPGGELGSYVEIPVVVDGHWWGVFSIGWTGPRVFSEYDRQRFDTFATRASLAVQNALLFERAQAAASMEERQRIARELHDSVSQALYGIGLGARTARRRLGEDAAPEVTEPVDYIVQLAESGLAETRALIFELVPDSLEQQGLVLALQRQAAATQSRFRVQVSAYLAEEPDIPVRTKEALYRICQESLHNMAKHAHATEATVTLECREGHVSLVVQDNGRGFDPTAEFPGHLGLKTMAERARRVGGDYRIESEPGHGTTVSVLVPVG